MFIYVLENDTYRETALVTEDIDTVRDYIIAARLQRPIYGPPGVRMLDLDDKPLRFTLTIWDNGRVFYTTTVIDAFVFPPSNMDICLTGLRK